MKKPVIVLSASYEQSALLPAFYNYGVFNSNCNAIEKAGGIPLIAPYLKEEADIAQLVEQADGVFLTGGDDIDPAFYGAEKRPECGAVCTERDRFEDALIKEALRQDKPILGVCRGAQMMNASLGGTLYQDLKAETRTEVDHTNYAKFAGGAHTIEVDENSILYRIMGQREMETNSLHHQGIRTLAPRLRAVAWTPDRLVEAVEVIGQTYAVCYQWHPEMMTDSEQYNKLFADFIAACKG